MRKISREKIKSNYENAMPFLEMFGDFDSGIDVRYRALACAILHRAVVDLHYSDDPISRNSAIAFFRSKLEMADAGRFTFLQCCEILDIEPSRITKELASRKLLNANLASNRPTYNVRIRSFFV